MKHLSNGITRMLQKYVGIRMETFVRAFIWCVTFGMLAWTFFAQITKAKYDPVVLLIICLVSIIGAGLVTQHFYKDVVGNNHVEDLTPDSKIMCQIVMNNKIFMARVKFLNAINTGSCKVRVLEIYRNDTWISWTVGDEIDVEGDQLAYLPPGF